MLRRSLAVIAAPLIYGAVSLPTNALIMAAMPDRFAPDGSTFDTLAVLVLLAGHVLYSILAGFVSTALTSTPNRGDLAAVLAVMLIITAIVTVMFWNAMPVWYHVSFAVLLVAFVSLGFRLRVNRLAAMADA